MRGFLIGIGIGIFSVASVVGFGLLANYFCGSGHAQAFLVSMVILMVLISGIYGAKTL